ncbi:winged helix-turn-helix domain-containing protein [Bifidobacterium primatium]|nr:winged helix-turn-helix domain-containing protein [Bifidobacterium primatium]
MRILLAAGGGALRNAVQAALESERHEVVAFPLPAETERPDGFDADVVIVDDRFDDSADPQAWTMVLRLARRAATLKLVSPRFAKPPRPTEPLALACDAELVKPFSDSQLLTAVHMLGDLSSHDGSAIVTRGALTLNLATRQAFYGDHRTPVPLSPREYGALEALVAANGEFLTFDEILDTVCGRGFFEQHDIMETALYTLMRKMRRAGLFITKHGDRYRIA